MSALLELTPEAFAARLAEGSGRACLTWDHDARAVVASHRWLDELAAWLGADERDMHGHEGLFFAVGPETGALMTATVHKTIRGQGAGGLRHWPYARVEELLRDGLRLSLGMSRKNALAGLWWGGGKGVIARQPGDRYEDPGYRRAVYREYGAFTTSLRGVYVTAEDVGTRPDDLASVFETTRFATCVPPAVGGSGNPSPATAKGVVCAMEGALDHTGRGSLAGKTVAMQGAGNVAAHMIDELLARDVARVVATEISARRVSALNDRFARTERGARVELRLSEPGDLSIFAEPCDVLAPNALGGVLGPQTIPMVQAPIICGAANNQLLDDRRDDRAIAGRGLVYVPDFVANRMGIVNCANEQYGIVGGPREDPAIERHFSRDWDNAVFVITKQILAQAERAGTTTSIAANELADAACLEPHPIWGHRGHAIVAGLLADGWASD